jgi:hypothetical protein
MDDECLHVITRTPLSLSSQELFAIFLPFPFWFWATLGGLTVVFATMAYLIQRAKRAKGADWVEQVLWYFSAQLGLGAPDEKFEPHVGLSFRAIWMCWLLFTFLISTAYSTFLVSYLTVTKFEKIPKTIQEFIESDYTLSRIYTGDTIDDMMLRAGDQLYQDLRKKLVWFKANTLIEFRYLRRHLCKMAANVALSYYIHELSY